MEEVSFHVAMEDTDATMTVGTLSLSSLRSPNSMFVKVLILLGPKTWTSDCVAIGSKKKPKSFKPRIMTLNVAAGLA